MCPLDQHPLESITQSNSAMPGSNFDKGWPLKVVIPAVAWLIANWLLISLFGTKAIFLFGLLTALWAAIDCSRLRAKGSRKLGIAFKPLVVFAVVAFFLWGFGFIWYLIMRNRVMTAPVDLQSQNASPPPAESWKCRKCGEDNPMSFDLCWNCSTRGRPAAIILNDTEPSVPIFPRGGNPWE